MTETQSPLPPLPTRPVSRQDLFGFLDRLNIAHTTHEHDPIFTVEEGQALKVNMPGAHTKNLFLKDKKGALILISAHQATQVALKHLHKTLNCGRLSFGKPDLLDTHLGVQPGSVTAFALLNDPEHKIRFILDEALMAHEIVNFHPLKNDATTAISAQNLLVFLRALGRDPEIVKLDEG